MVPAHPSEESENQLMGIEVPALGLAESKFDPIEQGVSRRNATARSNEYKGVPLP